MYFVYILESIKYGKYYVGQTSDIKKRLKIHNAGHNQSTRPYVPWILICTIEKPTRSEAMLLEKKLKNLSRARIRDFIKKYGI